MEPRPDNSHFQPITNYRQRFAEILRATPTIGQVSEQVNEQVTANNYRLVKKIDKFPFPQHVSHRIYDISDPSSGLRRIIIIHQPGTSLDYSFNEMGCIKSIFSSKIGDSSMVETVNFDPKTQEILKYSKKFSYPTGSIEEKIDLTFPNQNHTVTYEDKVTKLNKSETFKL